MASIQGNLTELKVERKMFILKFSYATFQADTFFYSEKMDLPFFESLPRGKEKNSNSKKGQKLTL